MKKLILITAMLSLVSNVFAQKETLYTHNSQEYFDAQKEYFQRITFKIGGGVLVPQGNLCNYFGVSPLMELSLDFPVTEKKSLELALQFAIPDQTKLFKYVRITDTIQAKASFVFNPMLRFKKNLSESSTSQIHVGFGLGVSIIKTDARNPFYSGNNQEEEKYEVIASFLASPSLVYVVKFKNNEELTLGLGLNYTPYKVEGSLQENIGSISLTPKIMYSF